MRGGTAVVLFALATAAWAEETGIQRAEEVEPPSSFEIPFQGPGQLATVWGWGRDRPDGDRALVLTRDGASQRISVEAPTRVRWRSPTELLVQQFVRPVQEGSGTRTVRITCDGKVTAILSDRDGLAGAEPSPDGQWVALNRYDQKGLRGIEIRVFDDSFELRATHPAPTSVREGSLAPGVIWSPDSSRLAVDLRASNVAEKVGNRYPRLTIIARDRAGYTRLPDSPSGQGAERGGRIPLFWNEDGIYVRTTKIGSGLLRCDPKGGGCTPIYSPGPDRLVIEGRQVGSRKALLLVKDFTVDPLEVRAKEIHEVNLATGEGHVFLRLPDGVFVSDLDWIADTGESG